MKKKHKDLQPWLDYFRLLQTYKQTGLLEVLPEKHEAYITQPALLTLIPGKNLTDLSPQDFPDIVLRIRTYAAFCSEQGEGYFTWPFALHIVKDEPPHDAICTILITPVRSWRTLWVTREKVEVIDYSVKNEE